MDNNFENKTIDKNRIIQIVVIISLIVVICVLIVIILKDDKNSNKYAKGSHTDTTTITTTTRDSSTAVELNLDNISFKSEDDSARSSKISLLNKFYYHRDDMKYSELNVICMNNNDHLVDVDFYLNFYKNGQRVNSEIGNSTNVKANHKFVVAISVDYADDYDSVDITYTTKKSKSVYTDLDISKDLFTFEEKELYSNKEIYYNYDIDDKDNKVLYGYIIYFKDEKEVFAETSIYMDKGFRFFPSNYKVDYDSVEFDVYSAYQKSNDY